MGTREMSRTSVLDDVVAVMDTPARMGKPLSPMKRRHLPGDLRTNDGSLFTKRRDGATCSAARGASDQETLKKRMPTRTRTDMRIWLLLSTRDCEHRDGFTVMSRHTAESERRPRHTRHCFGCCCCTMTPITTVATVGIQRCRKADRGSAALRIARFACRIFMVMAAGFACRSVTRMREALAPPSDVARVQAAAEGEVNHRRDSRDDADERSHGACLSCAPIIGASCQETQPDDLNRTL